MGLLIKENPDRIMPSQGFVKEDTVEFILQCIVKGELEKLPPAPIVRKHPSRSGYVAIDGHSLLVVKSMLHERAELYLAKSSIDYLSKKEFPKNSEESLSSRNRDLSKFESVLAKAEILQSEGIKTILDLRNKYEFLRDMESAKKHFNL